MNVKCKIIKTIFQRDDFRIFACSLLEPNSEIVLNPYGNFTIKGNLSYLFEGEEYELSLEEDTVDKYGTSYRVKQVQMEKFKNFDFENITPEETYKTLLSITTPDITESICKVYPDYVKMILTGHEKDIDLSKIHNVDKVRHRGYVKKINEKFKYYFLIQSNTKYELEADECKKICETYPTIEMANQAIEKNLYYVLINICERSFAKVDKLVCSVRNDLVESKIRAEYAIIDVLQRNEYEGSTYMDANEMAEYVAGIDDRLLPYIKKAVVKSGRIYFDDNTKRVALQSTYVAEYEMAQFVKERIEANTMPFNIDIDKYSEVDGFKLSEMQKQALNNLCKYQLSLLIGNAGSGKTSAVKAIVKMLEENNLRYILLAPTGKAAKKLSQSTNRKAMTMHRAVLTEMELAQDVIIVDEFSFFGTEWTNMLIKAIAYDINPNIHIMLIGDDAQLNPISHGKVLHDLIDSNKVPTTKLTEIFRYSEGGIYKVATDIRNGKSFIAQNKEQKFGKDWEFIPSNDIETTFIDEYTRLLDKGIKFTDITGIVPFNIGDIGTYELNNKIQAIVNPPKPDEFEEDVVSISLTTKNRKYQISFRVGDYVMNIVNNYKAVKYDDFLTLLDNGMDLSDVTQNEMTAVFNGDCGKIVKVLSYPFKALVIQFDEDLVIYNQSDFYKLRLAYVISDHKMQGSESPYVIHISSPKHAKMLTRNLLYVANSRAKISHIEIGDVGAINNALKIEESSERKTFLKEMLDNI